MKTRSRSRGGFTILELLVVIFIMMAMTGIAVAAFKQFLDTERIKLAGGQVVSALRMGRQYAMSRRTKVMVEFIDDIDCVEVLPETYTLYICADNSYEVFLNGTSVGSASNWQSMQTYVLAPQAGTNVLVVRATNEGSSPSPAGLLTELEIGSSRTSPNWQCCTTAPTDWPNATDAGQWSTAAYVNGAYGIAPWYSNINSPAPPGGTPAQWVWSEASTSTAAVGSVYFRTTFTYTPPSYAPSESAPRHVRIIPYLRVRDQVTGGFSWLLDQDSGSLKTMQLPSAIHYALKPTRASIAQYDPGDVIDQQTAVRKSYFDLMPDGTCTARPPDVEGWTTRVNTVILRDTMTNDLALLFVPPSSSFTRQRYLFGDEVDAFIAANSLYSLW